MSISKSFSGVILLKEVLPPVCGAGGVLMFLLGLGIRAIKSVPATAVAGLYLGYEIGSNAQTGNCGCR
jgi:hypothetical protein